MIARYAIGIVALIASTPALAEPLDAAAAQRFALGKLFAFTCFDSSRGAGCVYGDGSVVTCAARDRFTRCGCRQERSRSKARRSAPRSAAFRLSHASISTERMIKASAAQCPAWISHIAISLTART